jgi:chromosomal replication initiation ATPase DnaA
MYLEERILLLERRVAALENVPMPASAPPDGPRTRLAVIESRVSDQMGVPLDVLRSRDRHADVAWARQLTHALAVEFLGKNESTIARLLHVDHGTIHYSRTVVAARCETSEADRLLVEKLRGGLRQSFKVTDP